jgi:hypothetical protein
VIRGLKSKLHIAVSSMQEISPFIAAAATLARWPPLSPAWTRVKKKQSPPNLEKGEMRARWRAALMPRAYIRDLCLYSVRAFRSYNDIIIVDLRLICFSLGLKMCGLFRAVCVSMHLISFCDRSNIIMYVHT